MFDPDQFTPRNVAKWAVKFVMHREIASEVSDVITDHTSLEDDSYAVILPSQAIGWYASDRFGVMTDRIVDKAADKASALWTKRQEQKSTK